MSSRVNISPSVDPNTFVLDINSDNHRTRTTALISRVEAQHLCDKLRAFLGDPPMVPVPNAKLVIFPEPKEQPTEVEIVIR
jgi:hypothetical protein